MTPDKEQKMTKAIAAKLGDRAWRLNNLYWVENANGIKEKFHMNWAQRAFFAALWWLNVVLKARQLGLSTCSLVVMLDRSLFNKGQTCGIIDKTDSDAKKKLDRIEFAYDHLDDPDDAETAVVGAAVKQAVRLLKNNETELSFSNGSKVWAGTSLRGGTIQFLLISELGYISFYNPKKAQEIKTGALNTVHQGNIVIIESTHEGGKYGVNYDMIKVAQEAPAAPPELTPMDWRFHFFAWWQNPEYVLPLEGRRLLLPAELVEYFAKLSKGDELTPGIRLSDEQKHWYWKKRLTQGDAMWKEFPSTPEEAVNAVVKGAIYGTHMSKLRAQKRIADFTHDSRAPIFSFWDIGYSDFTSIWLVQQVGRDYLAINYYCNKGEDGAFYMKRILEWERKFDAPIAWHFLPHDADNKTGLVGKSSRDVLIEAGMDRRRITVVPRTPDTFVGINALRVLLAQFYFHKTNCGQEWRLDEQRMPSGIACLENYHTKEMKGDGMIYDEPVHDSASHGCDALRTFAEAEKQGLLPDAGRLARRAGKPQPLNVLRGPSEHSYAGNRPAKKLNIIR